jgi:chemosensory pili system protein ChpA (sensor histidine kinase/response regulator)
MKKTLLGKRIFLVEDEIVNVGVYSTLLSKLGAVMRHDILGFDIKQHVIEDLPIDLIILDIKLGRGQNGYDLVEDFKADVRLANIPVVVVTALDANSNMQKAKTLKLNGFISKPIDPREFPYQIARILNGQQVWIAE